jgi:hypothetical protein
MERMFVYPETLESQTTWTINLEDGENAYSSAGTASYRCKLYRTLLEQRTASRQFRLARTDNEHQGDRVNA